MDEKRDILAVLVYQLYKGFGIVDTLREMNINGSTWEHQGSILSAVNNAKNTMERLISWCGCTIKVSTSI